MVNEFLRNCFNDRDQRVQTKTDEVNAQIVAGTVFLTNNELRDFLELEEEIRTRRFTNVLDIIVACVAIQRAAGVDGVGKQVSYYLKLRIKILKINS